jgi:hypothetical protein
MKMYVSGRKGTQPYWNDAKGSFKKEPNQPEMVPKIHLTIN